MDYPHTLTAAPASAPHPGNRRRTRGARGLVFLVTAVGLLGGCKPDAKQSARALLDPNTAENKALLASSSVTKQRTEIRAAVLEGQWLANLSVEVEGIGKKKATLVGLPRREADDAVLARFRLARATESGPADLGITVRVTGFAKGPAWKNGDNAPAIFEARWIGATAMPQAADGARRAALQTDATRGGGCELHFVFGATGPGDSFQLLGTSRVLTVEVEGD